SIERTPLVARPATSPERPTATTRIARTLWRPRPFCLAHLADLPGERQRSAVSQIQVRGLEDDCVGSADSPLRYRDPAEEPKPFRRFASGLRSKEHHLLPPKSEQLR